jgi:hypothetical protein
MYAGIVSSGAASAPRALRFLQEKVADKLENGLPNPAFSRLAFHARGRLPLVAASDKMLSYLSRSVGQPN